MRDLILRKLGQHILWGFNDNYVTNVINTLHKEMYQWVIFVLPHTAQMTYGQLHNGHPHYYFGHVDSWT